VIDFPPPVGRQAARWDGDPDDFRARIAPARTFGWAHEAEALRSAGRAAAVDLAAVIVFTDDGVVDGCMPPGEDEPARHKLLDVIGDMTLYGGPPVGVVECFAPGHTANHAVFAEARATGILV
jgi:UDP-3-O-[3-hydroxymyristoyl] N-acetylglucosamine deacetylase